MRKITRLFFACPPQYLLFLAAVLHLTLVLILYSIGRFGVVPSQVDEHGTLIAVLPDGMTYQQEAVAAVEILTHAGIRAWLFAPFSPHLKLYSLSFLILGPLLGNNI